MSRLKRQRSDIRGGRIMQLTLMVLEVRRRSRRQEACLKGRCSSKKRVEAVAKIVQDRSITREQKTWKKKEISLLPKKDADEENEWDVDGLWSAAIKRGSGGPCTGCQGFLQWSGRLALALGDWGPPKQRYPGWGAASGKSLGQLGIGPRCPYIDAPRSQSWSLFAPWPMRATRDASSRTSIASWFYLILGIPGTSVLLKSALPIQELFRAPGPAMIIRTCCTSCAYQVAASTPSRPSSPCHSTLDLASDIRLSKRRRSGRIGVGGRAARSASRQLSTRTLQCKDIPSAGQPARWRRPIGLGISLERRLFQPQKPQAQTLPVLRIRPRPLLSCPSATDRHVP
jgi:hypothetical protein